MTTKINLATRLNPFLLVQQERSSWIMDTDLNPTRSGHGLRLRLKHISEGKEWVMGGTTTPGTLIGLARAA